jgi:DNA-binding MarR family transcriptional regulator
MARTVGTAGDDLTFYSLLAVLQSGMWLLSDIENYLRRYKLSHGRFSILLSLVESAQSTLAGIELATILGVSKPTITRMLGRLIEDRYLTCTADESDRRRKKYLLTRKATTLLEKIIPGYLRRLGVISGNLSENDKHRLIEILSRMNFLDPRKTIVRGKERTIAERSIEIRKLCRRGSAGDIDHLMSFLDETTDLPTTKIIDYHLGTVDNVEGFRRIEHYLFNGSQMQRNYCTLFFARRNEWRIVNRAYDMGLIDYVQAYSR